MSNTFTIENYREQNPSEKYIAIFDIAWPHPFGMTFRNWKLFRNQKGEWISGPAFSTEDAEGNKVWSAYIEFSKEKHKDFQKTVLEALKPYIGNHATKS